MIILMLFMAFITGAALYRLRGMGKETTFDFKRPIEQAAFCFVFLAAMQCFHVEFIFSTVCYIIAVAICCTGHGQYFPAMMAKAIEPERLDFIVKWFYGDDPRTEDKLVIEVEEAINLYGRTKLYNRCLFGMIITGGFVSLMPGIAIAFSNIGAGLMVAVSGFVFKPLAYDVAHRIWKNTDHAEYIYGGLQWLFIVNCILAFGDYEWTIRI